MIVNDVCANDVSYGLSEHYFSFPQHSKLGNFVMWWSPLWWPPRSQPFFFVVMQIHRWNK